MMTPDRYNVHAVPFAASQGGDRVFISTKENCDVREERKER